MSKEYILIILGVLLIASVIIKVVIRSSKKNNNKNIEKSNKSKKEIYLNEIKNIGKRNHEAYEGITKGKIKKISDERNNLFEEIISYNFDENDDTEIKEKVEKLKLEFNEFEKNYTKKIEKLEELERSYEEFIVFMREFYDTHTYYPHEFVHDTNRIQRKLESLKEERRGNPLGASNDYEAVFNVAKKRVDVFLNLHKEIVEVLKEDETNENSQIKHDIYMALTKADYRTVRIGIKKLKKRV